MLKVGDKVCCIKDYCSPNEYITDKFIENKIYRIHFIDNIDANFCAIENVFFIFPKYSFNKDITGPKFDEYFMTQKKYRKVKLDKINDSIV